jgi:hypothetical protein
MDDLIAKRFLELSAGRLEVFSSHIDDCLRRLTQDQLWHRGGEAQNSVANLVLHLCGNIRQCTAVLENSPDSRDRAAVWILCPPGDCACDDLAHCKAIAIRYRSSGEIRWSAFFASSPRSI